MKTLSRYKNFLTNQGLYRENQLFWKDTLASISEEVCEDWSVTQFANGEDFFDGNPIASALYPNLYKAIRIIQIADNPTIPLIKAWLEDVEYNERTVKELVLMIQPSDLAYNRAIIVITFFLTEMKISAVNRYIHALNTLYRRVIDLKKIDDTIHKVNPFDTNSVVEDTIREIYQQSTARKKSATRPSKVDKTACK